MVFQSGTGFVFKCLVGDLIMTVGSHSSGEEWVTGNVNDTRVDDLVAYCAGRESFLRFGMSEPPPSKRVPEFFGRMVNFSEDLIVPSSRDKICQGVVLKSRRRGTKLAIAWVQSCAYFSQHFWYFVGTKDLAKI
jgi:hypothetical protein